MYVCMHMANYDICKRKEKTAFSVTSATIYYGNNSRNNEIEIEYATQLLYITML